MIDFKSICNCNVDGKKIGFSWVLLMFVLYKILFCCNKGRICDLLKIDLLYVFLKLIIFDFLNLFYLYFIWFCEIKNKIKGLYVILFI